MNEEHSRNCRWGRLKVLAGLTATAFAVTLAVIVGNRLSDEALAVLAGTVCGVGAAIPTSLLIVAVSRRRDGPRQHPTMHQGTYPPVIVVTPHGGQQRPDIWNTIPPSLTRPIQRNFTVVGGAPADEGAVTER